MQKFQILLWFLLVNIISAQFQERIFEENVKTLQLFNPKTNDETPFIKKGEYFLLSFDVLDRGYEKFYYTIQHYDRHWNPSDLFESEYIRGYNNAIFKNYISSFNTLQNYTHYSLQFPNSELSPKLSGNYVLIVYRKNKDKPVFTKKFSIYEDIASIGISVERNSNDPLKNQRISVKTNLQNIQENLNLPQTSLCIIKNNNWFTSICDIPVLFNTNNVLSFNQLTNVFEGGNQFYTFDNKNLTVPGLGVESIRCKEICHTYLNKIIPDRINYDYNPDVSGAYYIQSFDVRSQRDPIFEGDYSWVYFSFFSPIKFKNDVYVVGSFNDYQMIKDNKMVYNSENELYEKSIYLKQGYYNYKFITTDQNKVIEGEISGSFWQTQNLFQALLYYTPIGGTYDTLIGYGEYRPKF